MTLTYEFCFKCKHHITGNKSEINNHFKNHKGYYK